MFYVLISIGRNPIFLEPKKLQSNKKKLNGYPNFYNLVYICININYIKFLKLAKKFKNTIYKHKYPKKNKLLEYFVSKIFLII